MENDSNRKDQVVTITGQKHLIRCRCILPQFRRHPDPPLHQFVVFSVLDDDKVRPHFVQCNNCGIVHKVTDILVSEIVKGREHMKSLKTVDDVRLGMPEQLAAVLEANGADLATWEAVSFTLEHQRWGDYVVISSDTDGAVSQGKYIKILGQGLFKVETYVRDMYATRE